MTGIVTNLKDVAAITALLAILGLPILALVLGELWLRRRR